MSWLGPSVILALVCFAGGCFLFQVVQLIYLNRVAAREHRRQVRKLELAKMKVEMFREYWDRLNEEQRQQFRVRMGDHLRRVQDQYWQDVAARDRTE